MLQVKLSEIIRIVIGVDPPGSLGTECGIVVAGTDREKHGYVLDDLSLFGSPNAWANVVLDAYMGWQADRIVAEVNYGGLMVKNTIEQAAKARHITISYKDVQASRGKAIRAEPVVALFEQDRCHLAGQFPLLEEEMTQWIPGETQRSPNRVDAMVWALTELMITGKDPNIRWL